MKFVRDPSHLEKTWIRHAFVNVIVPAVSGFSGQAHFELFPSAFLQIFMNMYETNPESCRIYMNQMTY